MNNFNVNFLLGVPRSGISIVMSYLRGHSDIETGYENPDHLYRLIKSQKWYAQYEEFLGIDAKSIRKLTFEACRIYTEYFYSQLCAKTGKKIAILKHPLLGSYSKELKQTFPKAKFLILVRHPYDVVASISYFRTVNPAIEALFPPRIVEIARVYATIMGRISLLMKTIPERVLVVKFEDFLADPRKFLKEVLDFFDCESSDEVLEKILEKGAAGNLCLTSSALDQTKLFIPEQRHLKLSFEEKRLIDSYAIAYRDLFNYKEK